MQQRLSMIDSRIGSFTDGVSRSNRGTVALSQDFNNFKHKREFGRGKVGDLYKKLEKTMNVDVDMYNLDIDDDDDDNFSGDSYSDAEETPDPEVVFGIAPKKAAGKGG